LIGVLVATAALLMVSRIRYRSFKSLDLRSRRSYLSVLLIVLVLVAVLVHPRSMMVLAGLYLGWGPAVWFWGWLMRGRGTRPADGTGHVPEEATHGPSVR
jgi:CDP-diacylglycerol--serine O-phosphatidyltransferase